MADDKKLPLAVTAIISEQLYEELSVIAHLEEKTLTQVAGTALAEYSRKYQSSGD